MLAVMNTAGLEQDVPPLQRVPELHDCEAHVICSLPMLDPYSADRRCPVLSPLDALMQDAEEVADEVFVYFFTNEANEPEVIRAIGDLGVPTAPMHRC